MTTSVPLAADPRELLACLDERAARFERRRRLA